MTDISDECTRRRWYEEDQQVNFPTSEMPREVVLRNMSRDERNGLAYLFGTRGVFPKLSRVIGGFSIFAVGTITYPFSYWHKLEEYLKNNDPSKMHYVHRRGQDIDLIIASNCFPGLIEEAVPYVTRQLEEAKKRRELSFKFSPEARKDGTSYMTVPKEYVAQEGQAVLRHKRKEYKGPNFEIKFRFCREFHLSFERSWKTEEKLAIERVGDYSFSLLDRHHSMIQAIDQVNLTPELFGEETPPRNKWLDSQAEGIIMGNRSYREWTAKQRGKKAEGYKPSPGELPF